ncbi:hypothetical protein HHI36_024069, partial [Cryptolaemus montrouzieri]
TDLPLPPLSKLLILPGYAYSSESCIKFRQLSIENNWDIIVYHEQTYELLRLGGKLQPITKNPDKHFLCSPLGNTFEESNSTTQFRILNVFNSRPKWSVKETLRTMNTTIKIVTFHNPPYTIVTNRTHFTGIEIKLIRMIVNDIPHVFKILYDKGLPSLSPSMTPHKTVSEELMKPHGGSDVGLSSLWLRLYRHDVTHSHSQQCNTFIVKKPTLYSENTFMFQALRLEIWILVGIVFLTELFLLHKFQKRETVSSFNSEPKMLIAIRTLAASSILKIPSQKYPIQRFILIQWIAFCLLMATCYNAGLTTSLRFPLLTSDIRNFDDMVKYKINWFDETDGVKNYLKSINDTITRSLVKLYHSEVNKTLRNSKLQGNNYGFRACCLPGGYVTNLEGIEANILENFRIIPKCIFNNHIAIGLRKNLPIKSVFNQKITRLIQHGLVDHLYREFSLRKRSDVMAKLSSSDPMKLHETLDLNKMTASFLLLFLSMCIASMIFIRECYLKRKKI